MMRSNLAPTYRRIPRPNHNQNRKNKVNAKFIKLDQQRHLRGEHAQLILNKVEKLVLVVGLAITIGLMLILVSTKITNDVYQHQAVTVNTRISKFHNMNNNSRQKISDLESNGRLRKIAHQSHLRFSNRDVRNVK